MFIGAENLKLTDLHMAHSLCFQSRSLKFCLFTLNCTIANEHFYKNICEFQIPAAHSYNQLLWYIFRRNFELISKLTISSDKRNRSRYKGFLVNSIDHDVKHPSKAGVNPIR